MSDYIIDFTDMTLLTPGGSVVDLDTVTIHGAAKGATWTALKLVAQNMGSVASYVETLKPKDGDVARQYDLMDLPAKPPKVLKVRVNELGPGELERAQKIIATQLQVNGLHPDYDTADDAAITGAWEVVSKCSVHKDKSPEQIAKIVAVSAFNWCRSAWDKANRLKKKSTVSIDDLGETI